LGIRNDARSATVIVLTLTEAALDAQRPAGFVNHDHRMRPVRLARATQVFDLVPGAKHAIIEHWPFRIEHCALGRMFAT
jgi:hypothetical protein